MKTLRLKIHEFDGESLIVSVASDVTKSQDPEDYGKVSFQPLIMWPDETKQENILRNLAYANIHRANQQVLEENISQDDVRIEYLKSLEGQVLEFDVKSLMDSFR